MGIFFGILCGLCLFGQQELRAEEAPLPYFYFAVHRTDVADNYNTLSPEILTHLIQKKGVQPRHLLVPLARHGSDAALEALLHFSLPRYELQRALAFAVWTRRDMALLQKIVRLAEPGQASLDAALARAYDNEDHLTAEWLESLGAKPREAVLYMLKPEPLAARLRLMDNPPRQLGAWLISGNYRLLETILAKGVWAPGHVYDALAAATARSDAKGLELLGTVPLHNHAYALMAKGELPEGLSLAEIRARIPEGDTCLDAFFPGTQPQTRRISFRDFAQHDAVGKAWPDTQRMEKLLACGASPSSGFMAVKTPEQRSLLKTLVEAGADLRDYNMEERMAAWGHMEDLRYLLEHGQHPGPLLAALPLEGLDVAKAFWLVEQGANPDILLTEAVLHKKIALQEQALAWGADPSMGLQFAGKDYDIDTAKRMLSAGAIADAGLFFVKDVAWNRGLPQSPEPLPFVRLMVESGALPDTAFGMPAVRADIAFVRWLLAQGANPSEWLFLPWDQASLGTTKTLLLAEEFSKNPKVGREALLRAAAKAREEIKEMPSRKAREVYEKLAKIYEEAAGQSRQ